MQKTLLIFDWILCILFGAMGLLTVIAIILMARQDFSFQLLITGVVSSLIAVAYSPLIRKTFLVRTLLTFVTLISIA